MEKKERSWLRAIQMDKPRCFLCIRRANRVPNSQVRELCEVMKRVDESTDECVLWWFGHIEGIASIIA